jgi:Rrf2 family protein
MNKDGKKKGALNLTQKVDYGLILLTTLAKTYKIQKSIKQIANEKKLSFPFLQKIASTLNEARLIKANRGKYGGYTLYKPSQNITLKEVIETLEGEITLLGCLNKNGICKKKKTCVIKNSFHLINRKFQNFFKEITIKDLIS